MTIEEQNQLTLKKLEDSPLAKMLAPEEPEHASETISN
jgi:hypothetical protein